MTVKLRYKQPDAERSELLEQPLADAAKPYAQASSDLSLAWRFSPSLSLKSLL